MQAVQYYPVLQWNQPAKEKSTEAPWCLLWTVIFWVKSVPPLKNAGNRNKVRKMELCPTKKLLYIKQREQRHYLGKVF